MKKPKTCPICNNTHFKRYSKCCSKECSTILRKQTCLKIYGHEASSQSSYVKDKVKKTNILRYGVEHSSQSKEVKDKIKDTNIQRYGVECVLQSKEIQNKIKDTNIQRYGYSSPLKNKECLAKLKDTNLKRYGSEFVTQNKDIRQKMKETTFNNYGVECIFKDENIRNAIKENRLNSKGYENANQFRITNYKDYNKDFIIQNFTTNGVVTLTQRTQLKEYFNISNENNMLKILQSWNISCEVSNNFSFSEKIVLKRLTEKYPNLTFKENIRTLIKNPKTQRFLELDIVVYYKDNIICAIEYNGVYFHNKENPIRETLKSNLCKELGVELFHIWEDNVYEDLLKVFRFLDNF